MLLKAGDRFRFILDTLGVDPATKKSILISEGEVIEVIQVVSQRMVAIAWNEERLLMGIEDLALRCEKL